MIVRFHIDPIEQSLFEYSVSHEGERLYADVGLASVEDCVVAAVEGLDGGVVGAEIAYKSVISGTYPLASLALMTAQIADHALQTTAAIEEVGGV